MSKQRIIQFVSIVGPLLIMVGWIGMYAIHLGSDQVVRLRIAGFDPRDLLAGHYLTYRIDYGMPADCRSADGVDREWCVCLSSDEISVIESQGFCSEISACPKLLRGQCRNGVFNAGIERFYFGEEHRAELAMVPRDASIIVALSKSGQGVVKEMMVGERLLTDWLREQKKSRSSAAPEE